MKTSIPRNYYETHTWLKIKKVKGPLRINSNGGEISVNHKAKITGYNKRLWFSRRDITNKIVLKNLTEQYRVTYGRNDQMFIEHSQVAGLPNMELLMHDSGIH